MVSCKISKMDIIMACLPAFINFGDFPAIADPVLKPVLNCFN